MWELFWVPCLVEILKRVAFQWRQRQIDAWPSVSRVNSWRSWTYYQYWLSRWIWLSTWASIAGELPLAFSEFFLDVPSSTFPRERMEHVGICLPPHYSCHLPSRHRREQCYWSAVCGRHSLFASIVRVPAVALALFFFFFASLTNYRTHRNLTMPAFMSSQSWRPEVWVPWEPHLDWSVGRVPCLFRDSEDRFAVNSFRVPAEFSSLQL